MTMMLHCGSEEVAFEDVCAVELPEQTMTYRPVPHGDLVRLITEEVKTRVGLEHPKQQFALNKNGTRMFGTLTYDLASTNGKDMMEAFDRLGDDQLKLLAKQQYGYSIAFRNSYDKSMSVGIVGGVLAWICDNLCLHGSDFTIKMPHTKNVWERVVPQVMVKVKDSIGQYQETVVFLEQMKSFEVSQDRAYEVLGLGWGRGVLTTNQAGVAFREYRASRKEGHTFHEHHGSAFGLYQAFTEALKLGKDVTRKIDKYTGASRLFEDAVLPADFTDNRQLMLEAGKVEEAAPVQ